MANRTQGPWRWDRNPHSWPNYERKNEGDHVPVLYKDDEELDRPDPGIRVASFSDISWHKAATIADFVCLACNSHDSLSAENARLQTERDIALMESIRVDSENARLREALAECVTDNPGSSCYNTGKKTRRLDAINETVRATLAIGGGW